MEIKQDIKQKQETEAEAFKRIMSQILLADPITSKGKEIMGVLGIGIDENLFFSSSGAYVEPFTLFEHSNKETHDVKSDPDPMPTPTYAHELTLNKLHNKKSTFERKLGELEDAIFLIKGETGAGKTTYTHYLKHKCDNIKFKICDFELSNKAINLFGRSFDFEEKFENNVWKFVSLMSEEVTELLFGKEYIKKYNTHEDYIKSLLVVYKDFFSLNRNGIVIDEKRPKEFFEYLEKYACQEISYSNLANRLYDLFEKKFCEFESKERHKDAIAFVCGILIRLTLCLSKLGNEQRTVYAVDNIEYYILHDKLHPIQECEIDTILMGITEATGHLQPRIDDYKVTRSDYKTCYSFLLVMRNSSASLIENKQYEDFKNESEIDITTWYCFDDICVKKENYFSGLVSALATNQYYRAYKYVVNDLSHFNWGMHDLVCRMFNFNFRRIILNLINALADQPISAIEQFNDDWGQCINDAEQHAKKHMCRKYIFRIILDNVQKDSFLDLLNVEMRSASQRKKTPAHDNPKSSYCRKVANILYQARLSGYNNGVDAYMTFPEIIQAVLKPPYIGDPTEDQISDLAYILYEMNISSNNDTSWAPLIMMKYNTEQDYTVENLKKEMLSEWHDYKVSNGSISKDFYKYGIKSTYAGEFFAKFVPDFEYFACRFASNYPALFAKENLTKYPNRQKHRCLELIEIVRKNAFQCIDEVVKRDNEFFASTGGGADPVDKFKRLYERNTPYQWIYRTSTTNTTRIPHPCRIINHHIGYLWHYTQYVKGLSDSIIAEKDRQEIIDGVNDEMNKYRRKIDFIRKNYPGYVQSNYSAL